MAFVRRRLCWPVAMFLILASGAAAQQGPQAAPADSGANMDMELARSDGTPSGWNAAMPPYRVSRDTAGAYRGAASARLESTGTPATNQFGTIAQAIDAAPYRGKRVRLRAAVRVEQAAPGWTGMWMRVDRPGGMGFFDNMQDRPITDPAWRSYDIEGDVAADAGKIAFGLVLSGTGKAWIDNVSLAIVDATPTPAADKGSPRSIIEKAGPVRSAPAPGDAAARPLSGRGLANLVALARVWGYLAHFDATDAAAGADWNRVAIAAAAEAEPARDARELADALNAALRPYAPDFCAYRAGVAPPCAKEAAPGGAVAWRHLGRDLGGSNVYRSTREPVAGVTPDQVLTVDLGGGVAARVPLAARVSADGHSLDRPSVPAPPPVKPAGWTPSGFDRTTRIADVIVAWNLFEHFYPYFDVVKTDWPAMLPVSLERAARDTDDRMFHATLQAMVAKLEDGHGNVFYFPPPTGNLPIAWGWIEDRLVVTAVSAAGAGGLAPGDVIERIDGEPAAARVAAEMALWSGSAPWRRVRALEVIRRGTPGRGIALTYSRPGAAGTARLAFAETPVAEPRPETLAEIAPGIVYVDVSRFPAPALEPAMAKLAAAKGILFDLRGYPDGSPEFLSHLSDTPFRSAGMRTPVITRPDRTGWTWQEGGWDMPALAPRFTRNVVFLTDARAISYAESILGTVRRGKLGTIVGAPTAGANGNVNPVLLPGGYVLLWTGMQVLAPDGGRHHGIGIQPDVPASPTIAGVRAGRDEVLDKGLALLEAGMRGD